MAIDDNINQVKLALRAERDAVKDNQDAPTPVADELRARALGAIFGGVVGYIDFMRLFAAGSADDLARLLPLEVPLNEERQTARAYLVRNGVCTMGTGELLDDNVVGRFNN